jgi:hypothetical protein
MAAYYESDIPIITDAEVVEAQVVPVINLHQSTIPPPARNPNYVSTATATLPISATTTQPQQPYYPSSTSSSSQVPVLAHVHTAMVTTTTSSNTTLPIPSRIIHRTLGRNAAGLLCPHCQRQTVTVVEDYVGVGTILAVFILAILFWPICWLPLCIPTCKRTNHYCGHPNCHKKVGETRVCA